MSRILPLIASGNYNLILSETLCFNPSDGLSVQIPTTSVNSSDNIIFNFSFLSDEKKEKGKIETEIKNNIISITIYNFDGSLLSGLTAPLKFRIGNIPISLFFTGMFLTDKNLPENRLLQFTFSIFQEK